MNQVDLSVRRSRHSAIGASTGSVLMKFHRISENCYAVENEKNRVCDATSGLVNLGGGVVIDT